MEKNITLDMKGSSKFVFMDTKLAKILGVITSVLKMGIDESEFHFLQH